MSLLLRMQGHFVRALGNIGDKDTENEVLLLEHDVPHSKFSEQVLSFLPKLPWIITDEVCINFNATELLWRVKGVQLNVICVNRNARTVIILIYCSPTQSWCSCNQMWHYCINWQGVTSTSLLNVTEQGL